MFFYCCLQVFFSVFPPIAAGLESYFGLTDVSTQIMACLKSKCFSPCQKNGTITAASPANTIGDGKIRGKEKSKHKAERTGFVSLGLFQCKCEDIQA